MASIFLSYAREDFACAEALARVLEAAGHSVWWDRHLKSGSEFAAEIEAALDAADAVLVAWSKVAVKSRWVRDEAAAGGDTGRLVPVTVDGTLPPMGFRQFHTMDLTGWKGAAKDERTTALLQAIEGRLKGKEDAGPVPRPAQRKRSARLRGKALWALATLFVLVISATTYFFILGREGPSDPAPKPTVALLPFTQASPDPELKDLAAKARASIAHILSQSGTPVRQVSTTAKDGRPSGDFLISGEFSRDSDKLIATIRLDEAAHGVTVLSRRFEAGPEDSRNLPERIGVQLAGRVAWVGRQMALDRRNPTHPDVTAELLKQGDLTGDDQQLQEYRTAQRVVVMAPNSGFAQLGLAFYTGFILDMIPREERAEAVAKARRAADRARALAPEFGDVYGPWCFLHSETRLAECEDDLRAGKRVDPNAPWLNHFLSQVMRRVGRLDESFELARLSYVDDPYPPRKIGMMLRMLETKGETEDAAKLSQQGERWWPEFRPLFFFERATGMTVRGDFEGLDRLEKEAGASLPELPRRSDLFAAIKSKSLPALRRACADPEGRAKECMLAFAALDDPDGAYALASKLYPRRLGRTPAETERIWLDDPFGAPLLDIITSPSAAPLRRDSRYLQLAHRVGLLAYWRSGRLPDFCRKDPEPICTQIRRPA